MDRHGTIVPSFKTSKAGRLKLILENGEYKTIAEDKQPDKEDQLRTVFENGNLLVDEIFENIKERIISNKQVEYVEE
jgi:nicotinamide phosphoribosyltransferase